MNDSLEDVNIRAIDTIQKATKKGVAFGLHCQEFKVLYVTLALQPSAIYFYVKDDTDGEHPDDDHAIVINDVDMFTFNLKKLEIRAPRSARILFHTGIDRAGGARIFNLF